MTVIDGRVAAITGAGSGIGRSLALELARRGCRLALCDVQIERVREVAAACADVGADVLVSQVDVADADAMRTWADEVVDHFGVVHLVFNNAGVAHHGDARTQSLEEIHRVLDINLHGVIHGTQLFLPHLLAAGDGHLVNVSSLFGIAAVPGQSAYNASKFGVRGYTEAVAAELLHEGAPVRVSCVHPGGVATNIARDATFGGAGSREALESAFDRLAVTSPDEAARIILRGVERDQLRILVGTDAKVVSAVVRMLGSRYIPVLARYAGRFLPQPQGGTTLDETGTTGGTG